MNKILYIYDHYYLLNGFNHLPEEEFTLKAGSEWKQCYASYNSFIKDYENHFFNKIDSSSDFNINSEDVLNRYQIYDNKNEKFIEFSNLDSDSIEDYINYLKQIEAECKLLQEKIKKASE